MSKEVSDLLGKLNGDMLALQGAGEKIAPPPPPPPATTEQAAAALAAVTPAHKAKKEDYDYAKKLVTEIKGLCADLEAQIDKETQVPKPPGEADQAQAETHKEAAHASSTGHAPSPGAPKK